MEEGCPRKENRALVSLVPSPTECQSFSRHSVGTVLLNVTGGGGGGEEQPNVTFYLCRKGKALTLPASLAGK